MKRISKISLWTISSLVFILAINHDVFGGDDGDWRRPISPVFGGDKILFTANPTDKVGLGTTTPQTQLHIISPQVPVVEGALSGASKPQLRLEDANGHWQLWGGKHFVIQEKESTKVIIAPGGKVGIGTESPSFPLSLGSKTGLTKLALFESGPDNSYGLGVVPGAFRLHLNGSGARFAFFDGDASDAKEILTVFGSGVTRVKVLEITGGSDLAEPFEIAGAKSIKSGMVASIDPKHQGQLLIANKAYDRNVAGIVSGANGLNPGLTLQQHGNATDGNHLVALTGRVYCWAEASNGSIQPGDLLTTSDTPGYAMKVTDHAKAQGAIIGKAMSFLETGRGLLLVLVTLQ